MLLNIYGRVDVAIGWVEVGTFIKFLCLSDIALIFNL